MKNVHAISVRY